MPNWVFNQINVSGTPETIEAFVQKAGAKHEAPEGYSRQDDEVFKFWNFVPVPKELFDEYYPNGDGNLGMEAKKTHPNNWYDWNCNNWGTKWEACRPEVSRDNPGEVAFTFDTAWSPPEPVFQAMVAQHPELRFKIRSVEEQGWGMEWMGVDGTLGLVKDWDIPDSHAEMMEHMGYCYCQDGREIEYQHDDCPPRLAMKTVEEFEAVSKSVDDKARKAEFVEKYGKGMVTPQK